jgi:hypothetical protein
MSITVERLATQRVVDSRTDVNSYARRTYQIFDGPQDTGFVQIPPDGGLPSENMNFTLNPPSTRVFVNRRLSILCTFRVTLTGILKNDTRAFNYLGTGAILNPTQVDGTPNVAADIGTDATNNGAAPRAFPLANATRSLQVSLNNDRLSQNIGQYWRATTRYANGLGQSEIDQGLAPTQLDIVQDYSQSAGTSISPFGSRGVNPVQTTRASLYGIRIYDNPEGDGVTVKTSVIEFTTIEPLFLSPFLFQRGSQDTGLIGIQTMNLQLTLGGRGSNSLGDAVFSLVGTGDKAPYVPEVLPGTGGLNVPRCTASATVQSASVFVNYLTPDALQIIPPINNYPYYEPIVNVTAVNGLVPAGATNIINMNNIQLNSIPSRILLYVDEQDQAAKVYRADAYCRIDRVDVSFDNRDAILSGATTVDLYNIAAKNNTNLTWTEWNRDTGSVLALDFGEDIPLRSNQAVGLRGSYNLRVRVTYTNVKTVSASANSYAEGVPLPYGVNLTCVIISTGVMTVAQQNVIRSVGILTNEDVINSKEQAAQPYKSRGDLYGDGFFDDLKTGFTSARDLFMKVMRPATALAAKILPGIAPEIAPVVSAFNSYINSEDSGPGNTGLVRSFGNGLVGGNVTGGRMVGGKKVTRAQLARMIK